VHRFSLAAAVQILLSEPVGFEVAVSLGSKLAAGAPSTRARGSERFARDRLARLTSSFVF
jgi:hypothetical protein